jgi:hypothetical protein
MENNVGCGRSEFRKGRRRERNDYFRLWRSRGRFRKDGRLSSKVPRFEA